MTDIFLKVVDMSINASWVVLAVLFLRFLLLRSAPKWIDVLLWGAVGFRLICPVSVKSIFSLIPGRQIVGTGVTDNAAPVIQNGTPNMGGVVDPIISQTPAVESVDPMQIWLPILTYIWLAGIVILLSCTAFTYFRLHVRVKEAVRYENNVYMSENAETAFVLGLFRPKIYLPYRMPEQDMHYVIAHEKTHIRGLDHWWKVLGFLLLAIHWFNPVMWFAYILLCRDMELACDEKVIKDLDEVQRADYSQALLGCSVKRRMGAACPIAFGEVGVKQRIQSVLNYRKNGYLFGVAALLCGICIAVFFMTDPKSGNGFGVTDFRFVQDANDGHPQLELDYRFLLEGEAYFHSMWIREVEPEEGELGPDGMGEYGGALGKYRMMIPFKTTPASYAFRQKYKAGQVYTLDALERYPEPLKFKVVYPPDYSVVIYVGSEKEFGFKDPALYHVRYLGGTMKIEMFGPGLEIEPETGLLPKAYRLANAYKASDILELSMGDGYRCYIDKTTFDIFINRDDNDREYIERYRISSWEWISGSRLDSMKIMALLKNVEEQGGKITLISGKTAYQKLADSYHLVKTEGSVTELYLICSDPGLTQIKEVYRLY